MSVTEGAPAVYGLRAGWMLAAMAVALAVLLGGQRLVQERREAPLIEALEDVPGVRSVRLARTAGGQVDIEAELSAEALLPEAIAALEREGRTRLGGRLGEVRVHDRRSPALQRAYDDMHFALFEAAQTGAYVAMSEAAKEIADDLGVDMRLHVDHSRIYLTLRLADAYLHEIVPQIGQSNRGEREGPAL